MAEEDADTGTTSAAPVVGQVKKRTTKPDPCQQCRGIDSFSTLKIDSVMLICHRETSEV